MIPPLGKSDRLLRRFCRTGDPRTLGALFDRTAPELLRAALWLCGDKSDAEDLLQRTFVTVIEARANYDPGRRALPWLCGILGKHAKRLQDKRARERDHHRRLATAATAPATRAGRSAVLESVHSPAAVDVAAEREVVDLIAELRGGLGSPYREVLDLYLGRGLKPDEIAQLLQREPATVRTQLSRGMARLRQRVPLTLFSPLVALAFVTPGSAVGQLAAMRAALLRQAGASADVATATVAGKPLLAVIAATALLSVAAFAIWVGVAEAAVVPVLDVVSAKERASRDTASLAVPPERQDRDAVALPPVDQAARSKSVSGRVVDEHGQPVPHARLWLSEHDKAIAGSDHGSCDAAGSFRLEVDGSRFLGASHPGHVGSYLHWLGTSDGQDVTLKLRGRSGVVPGRIYGAAGEPLAAATIEFGLPGGWRVTNSTHERAVYPPRRSGQTDASGSFEVDGIEPGHVDLVVRAEGHSPCYGEAYVAPGRNAALVFRLARGGTIAGGVRNEHGVAVAGAIVTASDERGETARATSDADGRYVLADLPAGKLALTAGDGMATTVHELELSTGQHSRWDPVLQASGSLTGRVVDRQQRPVAGIQVLAGPPTMLPDAPAATTGADGSFRLSVAGRSTDLYLRRGGAPLAVRQGVRGPVADPVGPSRGELILELADHELPTASVSGRIVDRAGRPIAAALSVMHHAFQVAWYEFVDPVTGRFRVAGIPPGSYTLMVEAEGFGRTPLRVAGVAPDEHRILPDLQLAAAGRVELELLADANRRRKVVKFARSDGAVVAHAISDDARVTVELPAGRYVASVFRGDYAGSVVALTVRGGETTHGTLPCTETARLALQLRCPAPPADGNRIDIRILDATGDFFDAYEVHAGREPDHAISIGLPIGRYRIECRATDGRTAETSVSIGATTARPTLEVELR